MRQVILIGAPTDSHWPSASRTSTCHASWPTVPAERSSAGRTGATRASIPDIFAQRIDAGGTRLWATNGTGVIVMLNLWQLNPVIVADGAGGAFFVWDDYRSGTSDIYVQRLDGAGVHQWTTNGVGLSTAPRSQRLSIAISDGAGGVIVAWSDKRNEDPNHDIYARRIGGDGVPVWTANGVPLCTIPGDQLVWSVVTDGAHGAIVSWGDGRNDVGDDNADIYAQRVDATGLAAPLAVDGPAPREFRLLRAHPNPTRAGVELRVELPAEARVSASVFDPAGAASAS